jgi:hypothetical protein
MYLEHIKSKLGSANAKIHTGKSEVVKRLHRKKGGCITRTRHDMGGIALPPAYSGMTPAPSAGKFGSPAPSAGVFGHKKGKRVKREPHFLGTLLGAASAIPALIDLFRKK